MNLSAQLMFVAFLTAVAYGEKSCDECSTEDGNIFNAIVLIEKSCIKEIDEFKNKKEFPIGPIVSQSISVLFFVIIVILFSFIKKLKINLMKRYWVTLSVVSILNDSCATLVYIKLKLLAESEGEIIFLVIALLVSSICEMLTFLWMLVICLKTFLTIK